MSGTSGNKSKKHICVALLFHIFNGKWMDSIKNKIKNFASSIFFHILVVAVLIFLIIGYNMALGLELRDCTYIIVGFILMWLFGFQLMKHYYEKRLRKKYFKEFSNLIDQFKRRQHKFRNQLQVVYSMYNMYHEYETLVEAQMQYMGKLADYEMPEDVLVLENPILIAHVYEKITEAQETGLRIKMNVNCSLEKCQLDDMHMVEILNALFDNAILDMRETEQTEFLVFEVEKGDGIIIRVANPHNELKHQDIRRIFEKGYSTKVENRGIALYHLRKLVQKYKMELLVENRKIEGKNYICFSVMLGKNTPLA